MSKIIGVTVGTPLSTDKIKEKIKPAFIATYGVTTFAEITTAVAEGKVVFMDYGPPEMTYRYQLQTYSAMYGICIFTSVDSSGRIYVATVESDGKWSNGYADVGGGGEGGGETEIFYAVYGATTYLEVFEAANAGKVVIVEYVTIQYGRRMYYLSEIDDVTGSFQFAAQGDAGTAYKIYLTRSGWSVSEEKINSVISVNGVEADKNGNVTLNFEAVASVSVLPEATEKQRGRLAILADGENDRLYICMKVAGSYMWREFDWKTADAKAVCGLVLCGQTVCGGN